VDSSLDWACAIRQLCAVHKSPGDNAPWPRQALGSIVAADAKFSHIFNYLAVSYRLAMAGAAAGVRPR
jgi:hypothetical protein